jgi:hypothetical protein
MEIDPITGLPILPKNTTILPPDVPVEQQTNLFPNGLPTADDPELTVDTGKPLVAPMSDPTMPAGAPLASTMNPNAIVPQMSSLLSQPIPQDPLELLSRSQRRMLGFAALRDAGLALQGKEGTAIQTTLEDFRERADMERKRQAAVARQQALQSMMPSAIPIAAGGDMIAQLEAQRQTLLQQAYLYPDLAPTIKLSIDDLNAEIERLRKEEFASQDTAMGASTVLNTVEDLSNAIKANPNITGPIGMILGIAPFTKAGEARLNIETLRANLAFDTLRNIKAGGATLGSVSAPELALLEAKVANLNLNRSTEAVLKSLEEIDRYYKQLVINAYNRADDPSKLDDIFGGRPAWAGGETAELPSFTFENAPIGELVVDPEDNKVYKFLGGNRDSASSWQEVQF